MHRILLSSGLIALAICFLAMQGDMRAQSTQSGMAPTLPSASAASYYYISKPGELTMQVNIWGAIRNPGRYEVPSSTDLVQLISYAGGPTAEAKMSDVRVTRLSTKNAPGTKAHYSVNLDELYQVADTTLALYPGDTIVIDRTGWSSFRDVLTIVTTAALITTAVANVIIAQQR